jgi:hypothetical protein
MVSGSQSASHYFTPRAREPAVSEKLPQRILPSSREKRNPGSENNLLLLHELPVLFRALTAHLGDMDRLVKGFG